MWRSFFMATGISMAIFGAECLGVEKMILTLRYTPKPAPVVQKTLFSEQVAKPAPVAREFTPKPFIPWTLMSTGAVTCLYSITLRKK